jgi:hypothetical protein
MGRRQFKQHLIETPEEGLILVPFQFQVNGTSDADHISGDSLVSAAFAEAGEYLCTLREKYAVCLGGFANVSNTADDIDLYTKVDFASVASAGTFTIRCMTAGTETTPTDDTLVGGFLLCKKTTRKARR